MQVLGDSGAMDTLKASMEEKFMANNPSKVSLSILLNSEGFTCGLHFNFIYIKFHIILLHMKSISYSSIV